MNKYKDKKILILGMARSGISASNLLVRKGAKVTVYDQKKIDELDIPAYLFKKIELICGVSPKQINPEEHDLIVTSPGIDPRNPVIERALNNNIEIISELQLGLDYLPKVRIVAVTGTNGKTTTCKLIQYITGGRVAGNIGNPLSSEVDNIKKDELIILEVSSYQIPFSPRLVPDIGILLNIFPEHIGWHETFEKYCKDKIKMFLRQKSGQYGIYNRNIRNLDKLLDGIKSKKIFFSSSDSVSKGLALDKNDIVYNDERGKKEVLISRKQIFIPGKHNLENIMAALAVWNILGKNELPDLRNFKLPSHRIEEIGKQNDIKFVNDSKATNMDSTYRAVECIPEPIILLMGGRSKNQMHPGLPDIIKKKVKKILAFGESRKQISRYFSTYVPVEETEGLKEAVLLAKKYGKPGYTILLSPGGSSFDEFRDYKDRGEKFKKWIEDSEKN